MHPQSVDNVTSASVLGCALVVHARLPAIKTDYLTSALLPGTILVRVELDGKVPAHVWLEPSTGRRLIVPVEFIRTRCEVISP